MGIQSPHQPGIGLKPGTQTPPANVLQVVKQVQEEAARQQAPHVGYGKVNPNQVPGQNMPPPQIRNIGHLGAGQGKLNRLNSNNLSKKLQGSRFSAQDVFCPINRSH